MFRTLKNSLYTRDKMNRSVKILSSLYKNDYSYYLFTRKLCSMSIDKDVITIEEVRTLKDNSKVFFVDVREPSEIENTGLIPGSINIPLNSVEKVLKTTTNEEFPKKFQREKPNFETPIVFTCRSGRRAGVAQEIARKLGFKNVRNYQGSWTEWEEKSSK